MSVDQVKQTTVTIRSIRKGFIDVAAPLVGFGLSEFTDMDGNVIKLAPEWSPYIGQFVDVLSGSLDRANAIMNRMKSANDVFASSPSADQFNDLKYQLEDLMMELKQDKAESFQVAEGFQQLSHDVLLVSAKTDIALEKAVDGDFEGRSELIQKYRGELGQAKVDIANVSSLIAVMVNIWAMITSDIIDLKANLDNTINANTVFNRFLSKRLAVSGQIHKQIVSVLGTYTEQTRAEL